MLKNSLTDRRTDYPGKFKIGNWNSSDLTYKNKRDIFTHSTHFYRIREEGGSGRAPTVHLRTDDVT